VSARAQRVDDSPGQAAHGATHPVTSHANLTGRLSCSHVAEEDGNERLVGCRQPPEQFSKHLEKVGCVRTDLGGDERFLRVCARYHKLGLAVGLAKRHELRSLSGFQVSEDPVELILRNLDVRATQDNLNSFMHGETTGRHQPFELNGDGAASPGGSRWTEATTFGARAVSPEPSECRNKVTHGIVPTVEPAQQRGVVFQRLHDRVLSEVLNVLLLETAQLAHDAGSTRNGA
jgi:hypothetical protein